MNDLLLSAICQRFQLGELLAPPRPVAGGTQHHLWHITTSKGDFAIKLLHPASISQPGTRARYRLTERIAAAMAAQGIPAVTALTRAGWPVQTIQGVGVLVFPWVEGARLPPGPASPAQARLIGASLGQMHALHLNIPGLEIPTWHVFRDDDWVLMARRGTEQQLAWAEHLRDLLRDIRWWSLLAQEANKRLWSQFVVSHGKLNQKNVLWQDASRFAIIDWDAAGLINPTIDLTATALAWSGLTVGEPDEASFRAVIDGYRSAGGAAQDSADDALASCLGTWLEWLEVHLRRSLREESSAEEQTLASKEIFTTLTTLQTLAEHMGLVAAWMAS